MTKQEAIEVIKLALSQVEWDYPMDYATAFDMAISALQAQDVPDTNVGGMISRRAAIDAFERFIHELGIMDEPYNYGEMALCEANVPSAQTEPCEDAVSRRAATAECFQSMVVMSSEFGSELPDGEKRFNDGLRKAIEKIRELPPVTLKRKTGRWLDNYQYGYKCSECGAYLEIDCGDVEMNFCPNCGAKMSRNEDEIGDKN